MSITIHIPTPLLRYSDGLEQVEVEGRTIKAAFESLFALHPGLRTRIVDARGHVFPYLILLVGTRLVARDAWEDEELNPGDELDLVPAVEGGGDVRMRGFQQRATFEAACAIALEPATPRVEHLGFEADLAGRVLARDVTSEVDVPPFDRAAMDGYALRAEDSFGATTYEPAELTLCGESMPGATTLPNVGAGQACRIMTGAPLPPGADAVVMAEDCEEQGASVRVSAAVSPAKHVGRRGEDIRVGSVVLRAGRHLRPQDVGLLASIGHQPCALFARPRVVVLVTGNELLAPGERPKPGFIVDSNTPMLAALVERDGGALIETRHLPDQRATIEAFLAQLTCDVLLCAGGSSVGREDYLPQLVAELGELDVHGVAMRPSAPTGIGRIGDAKVFLLPGNPVSCLCAYDLLAGPAIRLRGGRSAQSPYASRKLVLSQRIASQIGRLDYVRLALLEDDTVQPIALSGASLLSSTTRAVGFTLVDANSEGLDVGAEVEVQLYDGAAQA